MIFPPFGESDSGWSQEKRGWSHQQWDRAGSPESQAQQGLGHCGVGWLSAVGCLYYVLPCFAMNIWAIHFVTWPGRSSDLGISLKKPVPGERCQHCKQRCARFWGLLCHILLLVQADYVDSSLFMLVLIDNTMITLWLIDSNYRNLHQVHLFWPPHDAHGQDKNRKLSPKTKVPWHERLTQQKQKAEDPSAKGPTMPKAVQRSTAADFTVVTWQNQAKKGNIGILDAYPPLVQKYDMENHWF